VLIRSKNRVYFFDIHISDAFLRLSTFGLTIALFFSSWLLLSYTNQVIDAAFWPRLQEETADLAGKESTKLGTSEKSVYTLAMEQMSKDGAGITKFPDYADKISPNNQAVAMIRLRLRDIRLMVHFFGLCLLACAVFFLLITRVIYGNGDSRWRLFKWIYRVFNRDAVKRQPYGYVHSFTPFQRKIFELAFAASKGNPDGSFDFEIQRFYAKLWPTEEPISERRRALLAVTFFELCEEYFYFQIPGGKTYTFKTYCPILPFEDQVQREIVRDIQGKEIEIYRAGKFRFSVPLYNEYLRYRYHKLPHHLAYSLDDRKNPYAFRIYLTLWGITQDQRKDVAKQGLEGNPILVKLSLYDLFEWACFEMGTDHQNNLLEQVHADLGKLKEMGFIRNWFIEENHEKVSPLWYKDVALFVFDPQKNTFRMNTALVTNKIYQFDLAPFGELDKIKIVRRRCAYVDNFDTPCNRPAIEGSPYCKRHAKILESDSPRIFYGKVKALAAPERTPPEDVEDVPNARPVEPKSDEPPVPEKPAAPASEEKPSVIILPESDSGKPRSES